MGKMSKQIFKGHVTDVILILMSFFSNFLLKLCCFDFFLFFFLLFSLLNFDFSIFTFCYSIKYLLNINWEILLLAKSGKPCLTQDCG